MSIPTRGELADALNEAFGEFCADTGCVPDCFTIHGPRTTQLSADFHVGNFATFVVDILARNATSKGEIDAEQLNFPHGEEIMVALDDMLDPLIPANAEFRAVVLKILSMTYCTPKEPA